MAEENQKSQLEGGSAHHDAGQAATASGLTGALSGAARLLADFAHRKWVVVLLLLSSVLLFVITIVFAGVWAAAIKGYFGERLHEDTPVDDETRTSLAERMEGSNSSFGLPAAGRVPSYPGRGGGSGPGGGPGVDVPPHCDLVIPDQLDRRFMREGYTFTQETIGAPAGTTIQPDRGMIISMRYLCQRHSRIAISHIISAYVNMRFDPEQLASRDPQIIQNISAHNRGQAYDVTQIDFVYKVFRFPCPPSPNWTVEFWNDLNQLLLVLPCREPLNNVNTSFVGGPATAIPINIVWQDQPSQFALGGLPLNIDTALRSVAAYLGLPPEALRFVTGSPERTLAQIGRTYLEELLRLPAGSLQGDNLPEILQSAFRIRLGALLDQLPRPVWGENIRDWMRAAGAGWFEEAIGLFPGSLQGWNNPDELFRSIGLETAANILRIPSAYLSDPARAVQYLAALAPEDLEALRQDRLGQQLLPVMEALRSGNTQAAEGAMQNFGVHVLELTFGLQPGTIRCTPGRERDCPDPYATLQAVADRTGIDVTLLRSFMDRVVNNQTFGDLFENQGAPLLESALGLPQGSLAGVLSGQPVRFDPATVQVVARRLGIDVSAAQELLSAISQARSLVASMQQIGSALLAGSLQLSDPLALFQIATGTAPQDVINRVNQELDRLAARLNLPPDLIRLSQLLSGDPATLFQRLGGLHLGDMFGLPLSDIQRLLAGDLSVLLNLPQFRSVVDSLLHAFGIDLGRITNLFNGSAFLSDLARIGNQLNNFLGLFGIDQWLIMERVYRPEARRKVHLVIRELLEMPEALNDIDTRVTQLITYSYERDVQPFEADGTLDRVYGENRSPNFGLFAMPEARDHLHIAY